MKRIRLTLQYDGTHFSGWQYQPHKRSVQGVVQSTLRRILQEDIVLVGASRTDAGVHALGQVAHFDTEHTMSLRKLQGALTGLLPEDASVVRVEEVSKKFHATVDAKRKTYVYWIWNVSQRNPLFYKRAWHLWTELDWKAMKKASRYLLGRHDFAAFRAAQTDIKTSVRTLEKIVFRKENIPYRGAPLYSISVTGQGFLKYMVRNIVGTLVEVGEGKRKPKEVLKILKSLDRTQAGRTAPAWGLYLSKIFY